MKIYVGNSLVITFITLQKCEWKLHENEQVTLGKICICTTVKAKGKLPKKCDFFCTHIYLLRSVGLGSSSSSRKCMAEG